MKINARAYSLVAPVVLATLGFLAGSRASAADPPPAGSASPPEKTGTLHNAQTLKIAVVDIQRAARETEEGLRAQATLRKVYERRQGELMARQDELQRKKDDLQKQSQVMSQQALQRAIQDWERQMLDVQTLMGEAQREIQKRELELTTPIFSKLATASRSLAQTEGYDLVLERQAVPYVRGDLDLTDMLIQLYNQQYNGVSAPAGSAPAAPNKAPTAPAPAVPVPAPAASAK